MLNLISIIIPCYNQSRYLEEALQSVFMQTYTDWECIIVDDGSTDDTEFVAKKWLEKDIRFRYFYKENGGLSSARNKGLEFVKGNFILFLDADDFIASQKLALSIDLFNKDYNLDVVITDYDIVYGMNSKKNNPFYKLSVINFNFKTIVNDWDINFAIPIHCAIFKGGSISRLKFNENLRAKEDWLFWIQFFKKHKNVNFINQRLVSYRKHPESMTQSASYMGESHDKVITYVKQELSADEYEIFLLKRLDLYKSKYFEISLKYSSLKNSLTYRTSLKIKDILLNMGILFLIKTILQKLRK